MNDTTIASKAKAQLAGFMGKVFTHFSKPARRFVEECIYGIQASGDTKLSSIVRAIDDDIRPIYTEKRLSRNLDDETLEASIADAVLKDGARSVGADTLLLVDPTEIRKEFAHAMEHVTLVRDASRSSKEVLAEHIKRLGKRLNEVPQFAAYAIADGIRRAFTRFGRWIRAAAQAPAADTEPPPAPLLPGFADLFDTDDG